MAKYCRLYPVSFGFAFGLVSGIGWMLLCWAGARWGWGLPAINILSSLFYHVAPTFIGGLWALFNGFVHGFVFSIFVAIVYNCSCCCFCPSGTCDSSKD